MRFLRHWREAAENVAATPPTHRAWQPCRRTSSPGSAGFGDRRQEPVALDDYLDEGEDLGRRSPAAPGAENQPSGGNPARHRIRWPRQSVSEPDVRGHTLSDTPEALTRTGRHGVYTGIGIRGAPGAEQGHPGGRRAGQSRCALAGYFPEFRCRRCRSQPACCTPSSAAVSCTNN